MDDLKLKPDQVERFKTLAWPYLKSMLRTAMYFTRRQDKAEDLVQDAMMKALKSIDSYQEGTNMKAWLMTILRRTWIDNHRAVKGRGKEVSLSDLEGAFEPETAVAVTEVDGTWNHPDDLLNRIEDDVISQALRELSPTYRWVLLLVDVEQIPFAEAAEVLDIPVGTAKSRVHRARQLLRIKLATYAQERGWLEETERRVP